MVGLILIKLIVVEFRKLMLLLHFEKFSKVRSFKVISQYKQLLYKHLIFSYLINVKSNCVNKY